MSTSIFNQLSESVIKAGGLPNANRKAMYWINQRRTELSTWQESVEARKPDMASLTKWQYSKEIIGIHEIEIGKMYFYGYLAKHRATLPYWDALPLCMPIDYYDDGFLGLNLHYLNYRMRALLFDGLTNLQVYKTDFAARIKVTYEFLKQASQLRYFQPCVHRYLYGQVIKARAIHIGRSEWTTALFLPCEMFQKEPKQFVWEDSKRKLRRR